MILDADADAGVEEDNFIVKDNYQDTKKGTLNRYGLDIGHSMSYPYDCDNIYIGLFNLEKGG